MKRFDHLSQKTRVSLKEVLRRHVSTPQNGGRTNLRQLLQLLDTAIQVDLKDS